MRVFNRLGFVLIGLCTFSLVVTVLILSSRVGTTLQSLGLPDYVWDWNDPTKTDLTIVVFGDSWVDDGAVLEREGDTFRVSGKSNRNKLQGPSWTEVLCKELDCTQYFNFASSAPINVASPPSGALTSNAIFDELASHPDSIKTTHTPTLPDLPSQVSSYLALSKTLSPVKTLFVVSFGLWDAYHYASFALDKDRAEKVTEASIDTIFTQLDLLFASFTAQTEDALSDDELEEFDRAKVVHDFQVVIPQLIDPTFLPGWRSSRPAPLPPTSVAEEQKVAVRIVSRWNSYLKDKISGWGQDTAATAKSIISAANESDREEAEKHKEQNDGDKGKEEEVAEEIDELAPKPLLWQRTIHFPDLKTYFLDSLRNKYLETHKVFDANGLGTESSPYESVDAPCAPVAGFEELKRGVNMSLSSSKLDGEQLGKGSCGDAEKWLFWDEWDLGPRAQREVGINVGEGVKEENKKKSTGKK